MPITIRVVTRFILVACGLFCLVSSGIFASVLLRARTESGVVMFSQKIEDGQSTNNPYVLWGNRVVLHTEPHDWFSPPKAGDSVTVLVFGKDSMVKFERPFWRAWEWTAGWCVLGVASIIAGLWVLRNRPPNTALEPCRLRLKVEG